MYYCWPISSIALGSCCEPGCFAHTLISSLQIVPDFPKYCSSVDTPWSSSHTNSSSETISSHCIWSRKYSILQYSQSRLCWVYWQIAVYISKGRGEQYIPKTYNMHAYTCSSLPFSLSGDVHWLWIMVVRLSWLDSFIVVLISDTKKKLLISSLFSLSALLHCTYHTLPLLVLYY